MKRLLLTYLAVLALTVVFGPRPAHAGWLYSASYKAGYTYYAASACGHYAAGYYYYQPTYYPTYYPAYTVSYNPDSAKQLEIINKAMDVLAKMAQQNVPADGGGPLLRAQAPLTGIGVMTNKCASCHAADKVEAKGSKLTLLNGGNLAELSVEQRRQIVLRMFSADPAKVMPPGKPLSREERLKVAEFLGVQVVEAGN